MRCRLKNSRTVFETTYLSTGSASVRRAGELRNNIYRGGVTKRSEAVMSSPSRASPNHVDLSHCPQLQSCIGFWEQSIELDHSTRVARP